MSSKHRSAAAMVSVGTARLVEGNAAHEATLRAALAAGARVVDTASSYGAGSSERLVGRVLGGRGDVEVVSKFGYYLEHQQPDGSGGGAAPKLRHSLSPYFMRSELEASLSRLGNPSGGLGAFLVDSPERTLQPLIDQRNAAIAAADRARAASSGTDDDEGDSSAAAASFAAVSSAESALQAGREALVDQLTATFLALEEEVAAGRLRCYGVSSDALALEPDDPLHLPWRDVVGAAAAAANEFAASPPSNSSNSSSSSASPSRSSAFRILQLPVNVLEPRGADVALDIMSSSASLLSAPLRVMGTRPLTAVMPLQRRNDGGSFGATNSANANANAADSVATTSTTTWQRLVDFSPSIFTAENGDVISIDPLALAPGGYMSACQSALAHFDVEMPTDREATEDELELDAACRWLRQLLGDMNQQLVHFVSVAHYEEELTGQIMPMLNDKFEELDEGSAAVLQHFLAHYHGMVRYHAAQQARTQVLAALKQSEAASGQPNPPAADDDEQRSLQHLALGWALARPGLSNVVVGVTKEPHAHAAFSMEP